MNANKNSIINKGFTLNEQDLRRLIDISKEQLLKKSEEQHLEYFYSVKFKNGTLLDVSDLNEILTLENSGSGAIKTLEVTLQCSNREYYIRFKYGDPEFVDEDNRPITCSIFGKDRDWVFVTSSLLEERLEGTSKFRYWVPSIDINGFLSLFMIGFIACAMFFMVGVYDDTREYPYEYEKKWQDFVEHEVDVIQELKQSALDNHDMKPIDVLILHKELSKKADDIRKDGMQQRTEDFSKWIDENDEPTPSVLTFIAYIFMFGLLLPIVVQIYTVIARYVYPLFVFSWGDGKTEFDKTDSLRKYILGTVVVGIIISFIAGILASKI